MSTPTAMMIRTQSFDRPRASRHLSTSGAETWTAGRTAAQLDDRRLREDLRARLRDVRGLLGEDIPRTRQILRKLLVGRLECEAFDDGRRVGYRFKARGSYAAAPRRALHTTSGDPGGIWTVVGRASPQDPACRMREIAVKLSSQTSVRRRAAEC
jgi:hypothetical protein